ncbi:DNA mismatch repair protein MutL [Halorientalis sp. IM1011]|uniref:DNA mismatch repair endonuclease MutL n=1 Tax=Halorientalis sp. IM1011 TaxID=1932360 RepID=UPI00097CD4B5|nr:DNA mismatch repair endonuclease MutL [Halorientalis sp. IM1011]AQL42325.1 DNA mismatch repair protein MutL [Halorientalis sp. IM1011]
MSEDGSIRELDGKTVERIAAGEVVERPASVVKELVENSLDADASRVSVTVESGGKDGIRISDDGVGMTENEVRKAVEEHTTSKIRDIEDLESGVATLGFRGEALHAIGAVSRLTIETRPRGGGTGTELRVEGGEVTSVEPTGCPEGTTIEVEDLFYNVPARRKYLKQDGTEFAHVNTIVTSYALANPDVAVSLEHDGRETFATTGDGNLQSAVLSVYGRDVAKGMVAVDRGETGEGDDEDGDDAADDFPEGPLDGVSGLVSHPETNRASREYVTTYVNGRYVRSSTVRDAVVEAYGNQLAPDRYPFAVLDLSLPADTVDVNVHPRKMEVRFADAEGVAEQVRTAVENALLREGLIRSSAPRGRSAPEQTEIAPDRDDGGGEASASDGAAGRDGSESDSDTPAEPETTTRSPIGPDDVRDADPERPTGESRAGDVGTAPDTAVDDGAVESHDTERTRTSGVEQRTDETSAEPTPGHRVDPESADDGDARSDRHASDGRFRPGTDQVRLGDGEAATDERESFDRLPSMRVLGQYRDTYLVAETDDGLVLIDQHAADERVNYERLRERFAEGATSQALADPVELSLTAREAELFTEYEPALRRLGFRAERTGDRTVEVRTVPELVAQAAGPELIREVLSAFVTGESAAAETVDAAADDLLSDLACYPSITGNTSLTEGSVVSLLSALDDCENPWACPHGRPVVIEFEHGEIEDRFERDYPGHGGRE